MGNLPAGARKDLTDAQWRLLEPLLPAATGRGRPRRWTHRQLIAGIRWRIRIGAPWRDVPERYGTSQSIYGLFRRWQRDGTWAGVWARLQQIADAAGLIGWDIPRSTPRSTAPTSTPPAPATTPIANANHPVTNQPTTGWAAPAAAGPPRSTWPANKAASP